MKPERWLYVTVAIFCSLFPAEQAADAQEAGGLLVPALPARERLVYTVRHANAQELLNTLLPSFMDQSGNSMTGTADASSNSILLSGSPDQLAEALKILQLLDRQPKTVSIDFWIVDTRSAGWESTANKEIDAALKESPAKFVDLLQKLQGQKQAVVLNHLQMRGLEGQQSTAQLGERKARINAMTRTNAGRTNSVIFENLGTLATVTPRVNSDNRLVLAIDLTKSFSAPEDTGAVIAEGADGTVQARAPSAVTVQLKTTVNLSDGELASLGTLASGATDAGGDIRVLISASVVAPPAK
jgi:type II secretory pathway component GspD/PulD (secretin)